MQTYVTKSKKPDGRRLAPSPELHEAENIGTGNISLGGERNLDLPEALHARVQAQFGFRPESIRLRESAQVADIGAKVAAPVTPIPVSSAPVQGFFGRKKGKKNKKEPVNKLHDEFLNHYEKNIDAPFQTYYDLVGEGGMKGFDNRLVTAYTRGLDKEQQIEMWKDIQSGDETRKAPHLQRVFQRMLKSCTDLSDRNVITDDYITKNLSKSIEMTDDLTLTQNFMDINKDFKPEEHEQKLLDDTSKLGGAYSMVVIQALKSHGMLFMPDTTKHKRIMDTTDKDTQEYMEAAKMIMNTNTNVANMKDESGQDLFDKAQAAKKTYNMSNVKKAYESLTKSTGNKMSDFRKKHKVSEGSNVNGIDPRSVMDILNISTGGKGLTGDAYDEFLGNLGSKDMKDKKPIFDAFIKNMSDDILNFDESMFDEEYIVNNMDKVHDFTGGSTAFETVDKQRSHGYKMNKKHKKVINTAGDFHANYAAYVQMLLDNKHGIRSSKGSERTDNETVDMVKGMMMDSFKGVKAMQKQHKKPWWKKLLRI